MCAVPTRCKAPDCRAARDAFQRLASVLTNVPPMPGRFTSAHSDCITPLPCRIPLHHFRVSYLAQCSINPHSLIAFACRFTGCHSHHTAPCLPTSPIRAPHTLTGTPYPPHPHPVPHARTLHPIPPHPHQAHRCHPNQYPNPPTGTNTLNHPLLTLRTDAAPDPWVGPCP